MWSVAAESFGPWSHRGWWMAVWVYGCRRHCPVWPACQPCLFVPAWSNVLTARHTPRCPALPPPPPPPLTTPPTPSLHLTDLQLARLRVLELVRMVRNVASRFGARVNRCWNSLGHLSANVLCRNSFHVCWSFKDPRIDCNQCESCTLGLPGLEEPPRPPWPWLCQLSYVGSIELTRNKTHKTGFMAFGFWFRVVYRKPCQYFTDCHDQFRWFVH